MPTCIYEACNLFRICITIEINFINLFVSPIYFDLNYNYNARKQPI